MSSEFGDYEPEDAWDVDDSICVQIDNLLKRLDLLDGAREAAGRWRPVLVDIEHRLRPYTERGASGQLNERDALRVEQLTEDLVFVRGRDDRGE